MSSSKDVVSCLNSEVEVVEGKLMRQLSGLQVHKLLGTNLFGIPEQVKNASFERRCRSLVPSYSTCIGRSVELCKEQVAFVYKIHVKRNRSYTKKKLT